MAFDTAEKVAVDLSNTPPRGMPLRERRGTSHGKSPAYMGGVEPPNWEWRETSSDEPRTTEIWEKPEMITKTKGVIFDVKNKMHGLIAPLFGSFIGEKYDVETIDEVLNKVRDPNVGENVTKDVLVSDFLHFLKDNKRFDVLGRIEKKEEIDPETFNFKFRQERLDRFTYGVEGLGSEEAEANKRAIEAICDNWVSHPDRIESIGFDASSGVIKDVLMQEKPDNTGKTPDPISVPLEIFCAVLMIPEHKNDVGEIVGPAFVGSRSMEKYFKNGKTFIGPNTTQETLDKIMKKISIDGATLEGKDVRFYIVQPESPTRISENGVFTPVDLSSSRF